MHDLMMHYSGCCADSAPLHKLELIPTSPVDRAGPNNQPGVVLPEPGAPPPLQTLFFAAHEGSQLATNDLDLSQGLPSKFDLGL
jgi:hypothetical protein